MLLCGCQKAPCLVVASSGSKNACYSLLKGLRLSGSKKTCCTVAAKRPAAQWQQKGLLLSGIQKNSRSVAAKKHATQLQQKGQLLTGSKRTCCSVAACCVWTATRHGVPWQQIDIDYSWQVNDLQLSGSKKVCCSAAAKEPAAQWQQNSMPLSCSKKGLPPSCS